MFNKKNIKNGVFKNPDNHTYKITSFEKEEVLVNHKSFMSSMNILINEEYNDLHTLYYILKLHNNSHRERYIVCSSTCSTIELSITMTQLLSAVKEGLQS